MTNTLWGGRFAGSPALFMVDINASIDFDKRLWRHDILASQAHVAMLGATGIITAEEAKEIARLVGPADWASPEAIAVIEAAVASPSS